MKPPACRPRSQSQTCRSNESGESDTVTFKTQGQTFNMSSLIETTLMKQSVLKNILPGIVSEINMQMQNDLKSALQSMIKSTVSEVITDAVKAAVQPLRDEINQQNQKLITLLTKCSTLKADNEAVKKNLRSRKIILKC